MKFKSSYLVYVKITVFNTNSCSWCIFLLRLTSLVSGVPWGGLSKIINQRDTLRMQRPGLRPPILFHLCPTWPKDKASGAFNFNAPQRQDWRLTDTRRCSNKECTLGKNKKWRKKRGKITWNGCRHFTLRVGLASTSTLSSLSDEGGRSCSSTLRIE